MHGCCATGLKTCQNHIIHNSSTLHGAGVRANRKIHNSSTLQDGGCVCQPRRFTTSQLCNAAEGPVQSLQLVSVLDLLRHPHHAAKSNICKHGAASVGQGIKVFGRMGILGHVFHMPQLPEKGHVQSEARRPSRPTSCIALCRWAEESNPQTSSKAISKHRLAGRLAA